MIGEGTITYVIDICTCHKADYNNITQGKKQTYTCNAKKINRTVALNELILASPHCVATTIHV